MYVFYLIFTESRHSQQVLYRSVLANDIDEALDMLEAEFPWVNLLEFAAFEDRH